MTETDWAILSVLHKTKNLTKAAEVLYMSQPALTKRLKKMEADFGVAIAIRNTKSFVFTPQGEYLAAKAEELQHIFRLIQSDLQEMGQRTIGRIKVGVDNSCGRFILPVILHEYERAGGSIQVDVSIGLRNEIIHKMERDELHLAMVKGRVAGYEGVQKRLFSDQAYLVYGEPVSLQRLPSIPRIDFVMDPFNQELVDHWWYNHFDRPPLIGMKVSHGDTSREMVLKGLGYSIFLTSAYIRDYPQLYRAPMYMSDGAPFKRDAVLFCKHHHTQIPMVREFIDFILSIRQVLDAAAKLPVPGESSPFAE